MSYALDLQEDIYGLSPDVRRTCDWNSAVILAELLKRFVMMFQTLRDHVCYVCGLELLHRSSCRAMSSMM